MKSQAVLLALVIGLIACSRQDPLQPATGSIQHGDFTVEPLLPSSTCSGKTGRSSKAAQRIFYKNRIVTAVASSPTFSPYNPGRMLFTAACSNDGSESG